MWDRDRRWDKRGAAVMVAVISLSTATGACGGPSPHESAPDLPLQTTGGRHVTITFAESGLGTEGEATAASIRAFERANPGVKVHTEVLSPDSTTYLQQLEQRFIAGAVNPDVMECDVTYPAKFARAGWLLPLAGGHPDMSRYFAGAVTAARYDGRVYALPWFDNPEGLFYRTDLVPKPPIDPAQVVSDARAAMKADPELKEGLAFEGAKYEGAVTAWLTVNSAFGGELTTSKVATTGNAASLSWLQGAIYKDKIAPAAVTGWQEAQVQQEFTSGHAVFAIDYPFVEAVAAEGGPAKGHVGLVPFPAGPGGRPGAALGGEMLAINAKSKHATEAWKLIEYLTSPAVEVERAVATGDPPSLPAAYTASLYAKAPYFKEVKVLNEYAQARPVSPDYLQVSSYLQAAISSVLANQSAAQPALSAASRQVASVLGSH